MNRDAIEAIIDQVERGELVPIGLLRRVRAALAVELEFEELFTRAACVTPGGGSRPEELWQWRHACRLSSSSATSSPEEIFKAARISTRVQGLAPIDLARLEEWIG